MISFAFWLVVGGIIGLGLVYLLLGVLYLISELFNFILSLFFEGFG